MSIRISFQTPSPGWQLVPLEKRTSMELEARFKMRSDDAFGKVFGFNDAIRLLLRFKIDSFGSRRNWTRLWISKWRWCGWNEQLPEWGYSIVGKVEFDQRTWRRSLRNFQAGQLENKRFERFWNNTSDKWKWLFSDLVPAQVKFLKKWVDGKLGRINWKKEKIVTSCFLTVSPPLKL